MTNPNMIERIAEATPRLRTRFVAGYYVLTILTSVFILFFHASVPFAVDLVTAGFYLLATVLLYDLSQPKPRSLRVLREFGRPRELSFHPHDRPVNRIAPRGA